MNYEKILMFIHGGSGNRGCEAIIRSAAKIMNYVKKDEKVVYTTNKQQDHQMNLDKEVILKEAGLTINKNSLLGLILYLICALSYKLGNGYLQTRILYFNIFKALKKTDITITIGGDVYCYGRPYVYYYLHDFVSSNHMKSVFWGCSLEPKDIDEEMAADLQKYDLIMPRESITYNSLIDKGINKNTKLFPDPAFQLDTVELPLPAGFYPNKTIGINISPLIMGLEGSEGITFTNYVNLINYIIEKTDFQVALIPHVIWDSSNDNEPLSLLHDKFKSSGRTVLIDGCYNCMELKGFISRCRMFIGARTHATIAAYSTCVPTLVVGYSVKARGIARDIFGSEENMVVSVQSLKCEDDLVNAFRFIQQNEDSIRNHLNDIMPTYVEKAWQAGEEVRKLMDEK